MTLFLSLFGLIGWGVLKYRHDKKVNSLLEKWGKTCDSHQEALLEVLRLQEENKSLNQSIADRAFNHIDSHIQVNETKKAHARTRQQLLSSRFNRCN